ncbi:fibronectin type III domain-containing protein [Caldibacillus debilis]|uniref:Purple acid phosphatase N-terminal domain-containing protein n=1 Tax=Caldibacillus debilis GB1 TaxID=1339248 RepID=A0A420VCV7_9BACI|nr:fibronectin type III domain-containing protein [Caldibacillus debilis]RKO61366.1 hypothetical protein Cdeb_01682 [Caldibacillus debilis GB1]
MSRKGKNLLATLLIAAVFSLAVFAFMEKKAVNRAVENGYEATDIALGVGRDETEVNLSWYTPETSVPGVIQIAEKSFMKGSEFPVDRAKTVKALVSSASPGFSSHKGTVTGLDSSAEYVYRLGDGKGSGPAHLRFKPDGATPSRFFLYPIRKSGQAAIRRPMRPDGRIR